MEVLVLGKNKEEGDTMGRLHPKLRNTLIKVYFNRASFQNKFQ
jgi:hypothetical protein